MSDFKYNTEYSVEVKLGEYCTGGIEKFSAKENFKKT